MWHPLSLAQYNNFDIVSDNTLTQGALEDAIREKLLVSPSDLLVVNISGTRSPDFEIDKDSLYNLGRVASVIDNSIPEYDLEEIIANHSGDIISYFIQTLNKKDATPEMKKALYYGLKVLLKE